MSKLLKPKSYEKDNAWV